MAATETARLRVGLIGLGTVGTGVARMLLEQGDRMQRRAGRAIELAKVAVRDRSKLRDIALPDAMLSSIEEIVADPHIDVLVELIGGLDPSLAIVRSALEHGKEVVTANKALLCTHGPELFALARKHGRTIAFEAAVAGGIPIIHVLGQAMTANQITGIQAILNGTSNFILSQMVHHQATYSAALAEAQRLGYAEADPAMDVQGTDAAQKLALLTQLAFGTRVTPDDFLVEGIDTLDLADLSSAGELGYSVKLLATARLINGQLELHTQPTLIRKDRPLAQIDGAYNMVALTGDAVGTTWYSGPGAGQMATASSVVSDIIDLAVGRAQFTFRHLDLWGEHPSIPLQPVEENSRRYYMRLQVADRPHVIADITHVLGKHGISLSSVIQREAPEVDESASKTNPPRVPLVVMTHRTKEGQLRAAAAELRELNSVYFPWVTMPVSDM